MCLKIMLILTNSDFNQASVVSLKKLHTAIYTYMNIALNLKDIMRYLYKKPSHILKYKLIIK